MPHVTLPGSTPLEQLYPEAYADMGARLSEALCVSSYSARSAAKVMNFALNYGTSPTDAARMLAPIPTPEVRNVLNLWRLAR